jgi:glc operon protein GlcG
MEKIDLETAQGLIARAAEAARSHYQRPVCVAVCDATGFLIAFARGDGSPVRSIEISQGKAYSAARMGVSTTEFLARLHKDHIPASYYCDPRLTGLPGGTVLKQGGVILGAIGISGLKSNEDQTIADLVAEQFAKPAQA